MNFTAHNSAHDRHQGSSIRSRAILTAGLTFLTASALWTFPARADGGLELHTDYPGVSAKPGDNLSIPIQMDNQSGSGMDVDVDITSLPEGWEGYLQGGTYQVSQVYVPTGEAAASLTLHLTVPDELSEGQYTVSLSGQSAEGASDSLDIDFQVAEVNAGRGSFSTEYPNQEGASGTKFSFSTTLINNDLKPQSYSLSSNAPAGWSVGFTPSGESSKVAAIDVEAGKSQGISVDVAPPQNVEAGEYTISLSAISAEETLSQELTVTVTGTYGLDLATPDGRLSFDAHANQTSDVTLQIVNTGNVDLTNVSLNSSAPSGWTVTYDLEENIIESLPAGTTTEVIAHVKPSSDAITGDYVTSFTVSGEGISDSVEFRVSVKTSTLWGFVAIALILCTAGGLGYVFRKYGRR